MTSVGSVGRRRWIAAAGRCRGARPGCAARHARRSAGRCRRCWPARAARGRASRAPVGAPAWAPWTSPPWTETTQRDPRRGPAHARRRRGRRSGRGRGRTGTRRAGVTARAAARAPPTPPTSRSSRAGAARGSAGSRPGSRRASLPGWRSARRASAPAPAAGRASRQRRQRPVQDEHPHLGAGVPRGQRPGGAPRCRASGRPPAGSTRRRSRPSSPAAVGDDVRWASAAVVYGRSARNAPALGDRVVAVIGGWRSGAARGRSAVASITPMRQPCRCATADQCASRPQPKRSGGNGSSVVEGVARAARTPVRSRRTRVSRTTESGRRRVTSQAAWERHRWAGWASARSKRSARKTNASRKPRGSRRRRRAPAASRSPSAGWRSSSALRFSNLPRSPTRRRSTSNRTSWRERSELGAGGGEHVGHVRRARSPARARGARGDGGRGAAQAPRLRASRAPAASQTASATAARVVARMPQTWPLVPDRKSVERGSRPRAATAPRATRAAGVRGRARSRSGSAGG